MLSQPVRGVHGLSHVRMSVIIRQKIHMGLLDFSRHFPRDFGAVDFYREKVDNLNMFQLFRKKSKKRTF
jgi:hypothetical protein